MKDVTGFEGVYGVTRGGGVWSHRRGRLMSPTRQPNKRGKFYLRVSLCIGGKYTKYYVHRLVAEAYIQNPACKPTVNHKNGDTEDNAEGNLEWSTHKEQLEHAFATGLNKSFGSAAWGAKLKDLDVERIKVLYASGTLQQALADEYGVTQSVISRVVNNIQYRRKQPTGE